VACTLHTAPDMKDSSAVSAWMYRRFTNRDLRVLVITPSHGSLNSSIGYAHCCVDFDPRSYNVREDSRPSHDYVFSTWSLTLISTPTTAAFARAPALPTTISARLEAPPKLTAASKPVAKTATYPKPTTIPKAIPVKLHL